MGEFLHYHNPEMIEGPNWDMTMRKEEGWNLIGRVEKKGNQRRGSSQMTLKMLSLDYRENAENHKVRFGNHLERIGLQINSVLEFVVFEGLMDNHEEMTCRLLEIWH